MTPETLKTFRDAGLALLIVGVIIGLLSMIGCTSVTGGSATRSESGVAITIPTQWGPMVVSDTRSAAATSQPSITSTGDVKGNLSGGEAGELVGFKFAGVQNTVANWTLAGIALLAGIASFKLLPTPKNMLAAGACAGVAILAVVAPATLATLALAAVIIPIGLYAIANLSDLRRHREQLIAGVHDTIERLPEHAEDIKDAMARQQVDPKLKAAVKNV